MAETTAVKAPKKRETKPGLRRVTVTLAEDEYKALAAVSADQMREPNNMLTFMLKGRIAGMLADYPKVENY